MHDLSEALTPDVFAYGLRAMGFTALASMDQVVSQMDIHKDETCIHARFYDGMDATRWWTLTHILTEVSYPVFLSEVAQEMEGRGIGPIRAKNEKTPEDKLLANYEAILLSRHGIQPPQYRGVDLIDCCAYGGWGEVRLSLSESSLLLQYPNGEMLVTGAAFTHDLGLSLIPAIAVVLTENNFGGLTP